MFRYAENELTEWLTDKGRKPLVLRGARQVGKSTLVRNFTQNAKRELIEVNLEKIQLKSLKNEEINLKNLITEIEDRLNQEITNKTILFLDEIQAQPGIFKYLRYFYEERPDIPVLAAGSLLEFYLSEFEISVPVGRIQYFFLGPMTYFEFLLALNKKLLIKRLESPSELTPVQHAEALKLFQEYLFIGGMPAAVKSYVQDQNFKKVRQIQDSILQTYQDDFLKYAKKSKIPHLHKVFDFVPYNLGRKVKYSAIDKTVQSVEIRKAIDLLTQARVILPVYHTNASGLPLSTFKEETVFKLYFLDVGLALCAQKVSWQELSSEEVLNQKGGTAEQFVAQHLFFREKGLTEPHLYYWLKDKTVGKAEIDFLFNFGRSIFPIEVKAGKTGSLKSLWQFLLEKKVKLAIKFSTSEFEVKEESHKIVQDDQESKVSAVIYHLPLYLAEKTIEICQI
ncbi:MAG: hypothetical protein FMNOHCHN_03618 [Ignavibacteriaceae bacterium]|nr:hypothetical protein [Ignavibacteriaceae bacterium]GIL17928.1 MAG: ATPase [Oligoflexia bacterium]